MTYRNHSLLSRLFSPVSRSIIVTLSLAAVVTGRFVDGLEQPDMQEESAYGATLTIPQSYEQCLVDGSRPYPERCSLHPDRLIKDKVPIAYGLRFNSPNDKARFPYSNKWIDGGCVPGSYRRVTVMYCPQCRKTEAEVAEILKRPKHR